MTNKNYSTNLSSYDEAAALQQLVDAANAAIEKVNSSFDTDAEYCDEFTVTINGQQTAFYLGGPQFEALLAFVQHIAAENFHSIDINSSAAERG